jgi:hypothetical protein
VAPAAAQRLTTLEIDEAAGNGQVDVGPMNTTGQCAVAPRCTNIVR